jgi:peptidoglycan/LPS O-acetylase OafA/YrhL
MKHLPSPVAYREDINGMRAWAVIAVLLFHFQLPGFDAGFLGVDIFFVISGFLMTAIIVKGLERDNFSILTFYMARARRILPALMVMIGVLLALGWFWLSTPDYQALATQSVHALFFLSNFLFNEQAGYFDVAAHEKWLLHTWSLAVEAQFYLLFPIFLVWLWKFKPGIKTLLWGLGLLFIASLSMSIVLSNIKAVAAFYLLPTRSWELVAGGLVFLIGREVISLQRFAMPMLWSGFALWLLAFLLLDEGYSWPSAWALLPVLGTALIMLANQTQAKLTVNPITQWLGDRSYSLYLWHWPLVVALYFAGLQNDWLWISGAVALSLVLAHLSYHLVEVPTRVYLSGSGLRKEVFAIAVGALVIGFASIAIQNIAFEQRLPAMVEIAAAEENNRYPRIEECFIEARHDGMPAGCIEAADKVNTLGHQSLSALIIGDSHSYATVSALAQSSENSVKFWGVTSCPTVFGAKYMAGQMPENKSDMCLLFNEWIKGEIAGMDYRLPLVIVNRTSLYLWGPNEQPASLNKPKVYFDRAPAGSDDEGFINEFQNKIIEAACFYKKDRPVYLLRPIPEMGVNVPKTLARNLMLGLDADIKIPLEDYHQRHKWAWEAQDRAVELCGVKILNPLPYLCDDQYCYGSRNGRPLYFDDDHLSEYGNKFLVPMFEQVFFDQLATD